MPTTTTTSEQRLMLDFREFGFAEQLMLGRYQAARAFRGLDQHRHPRMMEICYLASGMQVYEVGQRRYVLKGNDVFLTFPGETHSSGGFPQEKGVLYWLQVRFPAADESFLQLPSPLVQPLFARLAQLPGHFFRGSRRMQRVLDDILLAAQQPSDPLAPLTIASKTLAFLLEVVACAASEQAEETPSDLNRVLDYIDAHLDQPLPVSQLAQMLQLSPSRFKAKFKQQVGIPPAEYTLRRKIARAKQLLDAGDDSITDIAYTLGFSSSQYFATVFKRFTNQRPSEYIQSQ